MEVSFDRIKLLPDNQVSIQTEKKITSLQIAENYFYNQNL